MLSITDYDLYLTLTSDSHLKSSSQKLYHERTAAQGTFFPVPRVQRVGYFHVDECGLRDVVSLSLPG
ncbi:MAG TPA: hypothetical protein DIT99_31850, partial [Candidatus Latescibacteria bacterium]|nr:hypothetical protein [Candidatus Latescibacterota bacterium]